MWTHTNAPRSPARLIFAGALVLAAGLAPVRGQDGAGPVGEWKEAGSLSVGRYAPGAAHLPDGRVLVAGGYSFETKQTHATSDLFDPRTGMWSEGPVMRFDRNFPEVMPLDGGVTLFVAGYRIRQGTTATTERVVPPPAAGGAPRIEPGEPSLEERELASSVRLADGRILFTGGYTTFRRKTLNSAELYDPKKDQFVATPPMHHARFGHTSVLLPDGRALIVGGKVIPGELPALTAELYDPKANAFTETGEMSVGRDRCTAWVLPDRKRVLVAGGATHEGGSVPAKASEIYDLRSGKFSQGPELVRDRMAHTMTMLDGGRVLLVGGYSHSENGTTRQAEVWDPKAERFQDAGTLRHGRHDHAAVRLKDGRVLVAGGKEAPARQGIESPVLAEVWSPGAK